MVISLKYFLSVLTLFAAFSSVQTFVLCDVSPAQGTTHYAVGHKHDDRSLDQEHFALLETFTKVIKVLRENRELHCNAEEKILVNRLLGTIESSLAKRSNSEKSNSEIAHRLRTIMQLFGLSSPALDNAQGNSIREETDTIIRALQVCLAERNLTPFNRKFRSFVDAVEPYNTTLVIASLPVLGLLAYSLHGVVQKTFMRALSVSSEIGSKLVGGAKLPDNAPGDASIKLASSAKLPDNAPAIQSWGLFSKALVVPAAGMIYKALDTSVFQDALTKTSDSIKKAWATLQGRPFSGSNPASSSKIALKDVPAPAVIKDHLQALARMMVSQEDVYKQQGGVGLKTLLIYGDTSLVQLLAGGLADEVVRVSRESNMPMACPVATIHASKLLKDSLKMSLEKIMSYNKACIIVIQDLDWAADEESYSTIVAEIVNGMKTVTKLHQQYIVIGTARTPEFVDPILKQSSVFGTRLMISPAHDASVLAACIERAEKVYGIAIGEGKLRHQLESYICENSFGDFINLFASAYTKALPQIGVSPLDARAIERELALVACEGSARLGAEVAEAS